MIDRGTIGFLLVLAGVAACAFLISRSRLTVSVRRLLVAGLAIRLVGSLAYLHGIGAAYGGGDYLLYYREGLQLADTAFTGGAYSIWDPDIWIRDSWWGTSFVTRVTALLLVIIGPTLSGAFIVYALLSYVGILGVAFAFYRAYPAIPLERYLLLVALFPSLWFWPAAVGKDALVLCGVGLATLGFVGRRARPQWALMAVGVGLVFCIRPQVAATLVFSLGAAQWLGAGLHWTLGNIVRGALFVGVGVWVLSLAAGALNVELFNSDEVEDYLASRSEVSAIGGSAMEVAEEGVSPWLATVTTLFRPFLWEARGLTAFLAALEMVVFWGIAWSRRRHINAFIRTQRRTRLFWFAAVFVVVYATALGMSISNLGIIARQRVHILPFLFLFFVGNEERAAWRPQPDAARRQRRLRGVARFGVRTGKRRHGGLWIQ